MVRFACTFGKRSASTVATSMYSFHGDAVHSFRDAYRRKTRLTPHDRCPFVRQPLSSPLRRMTRHCISQVRGMGTQPPPSSDDAPPITRKFPETASIFSLPRQLAPLKKQWDTFQNGLSTLKGDYLTSLHIREAELTRLFIQRKHHLEYNRRMRRRRPIADDGDPPRPTSHPPTPLRHAPSHRRQREHLRRLSRDLRITLPTVGAFIGLPFVGYSFLVLGLMFPRLLLSRHFHTPRQRREFSEGEYLERRRWYDLLGDHFWGSCMRNVPGLVWNSSPAVTEEGDALSCVGVDAAGPVLRDDAVLRLFEGAFDSPHPPDADAGRRSSAEGTDPRSVTPSPPPSPPPREHFASLSLDRLPREHLASLSLSSGLASRLPHAAGPFVLKLFFPSSYLRWGLGKLARDLRSDDAELLGECHHLVGCESMTEEEVLDACLLRGLPTSAACRRRSNVRRDDAKSSSDTSVVAGGDDDDLTVMRECLTNHLHMLDVVTRLPVSSKERPDHDANIKLFTLHLPAIRWHLMLKADPLDHVPPS